MSLVSRDGVAQEDRTAGEYQLREVAVWAGSRVARWRSLWLLNLHEAHGMSYGQIAELVGLDRSYVCRQIGRVRTDLKTRFNPEVN